ncbi:TRP-like ion channel Pkd2, partial [Cymbomonas tetramitiformis]
MTVQARKTFVHSESVLKKRNDTRKKKSSKNKSLAVIVVSDAVLERVKEFIRVRNIYFLLFLYFLTLGFYFFVMNSQLQYSNLPKMASALRRATVPPKVGVTYLDWLKTQILEVWKDPVCGDNICHEPYEFASFGRFGCQYDCGEATDVASVLVFVEVDFREIVQHLPTYAVEDLRKRVHWNLCLRDAVRLEHNLPEVCWFEEDRTFTAQHERVVESAKLKQGEWFIRVSKDYFRVVHGKIMDVSNASDQVQLPTIPSWDPCPDPPVSPPPPAVPPAPLNAPPEPPSRTWTPTTSPTPVPLRTTSSPTPAPFSWVVSQQRPRQLTPMHIVDNEVTSPDSMIIVTPPLPPFSFSFSFFFSSTGTRTDCRQLCETTNNCMAFAYHVNYAWCFFKECFDPSAALWESFDSSYEFHYFDRAGCSDSVGGDVEDALSGRSLFSTNMSHESATLSNLGGGSESHQASDDTVWIDRDHQEASIESTTALR